MKPQYSRYYTYIKPALQNKFIKTYSSTVFSIITILVFSYFAIRPTISTIVSLQKSIEQHQQTLDKIRKKQDLLIKVDENYSKIPSQTQQDIEFLLPYSTSLKDLINSLDNLIQTNQASSSGIQIEPVDLNRKPTNLIRSPEIKEVNFSINIRGSYPQLQSILSKINSSSRLLKIKSADLNKSAEGDLTLSIIASAFYLKN